MCIAYNRESQLIYTGGHDGSLIAWNFETGYIKFYLHELDPTCISKNGNYILESKSVDCVSLPPSHTIDHRPIQEEADSVGDGRPNDQVLGLRCD